jgi:hypothetical protein
MTVFIDFSDISETTEVTVDDFRASGENR